LVPKRWGSMWNLEGSTILKWGTWHQKRWG
jgi:hypothetical protein